ncbi:MAG: sulfatase-like hydrolase/transferase [Flavobacteriia bacterium]|nr:sulfatase-like hydrolase/transferase [Flavobacteriia bacterium]
MKKIIVGVFGLMYTFIIQAQKNTILIIADDISPDYFGMYNESSDTANTPNIRKLLEKGVLFTKAWASPLCSITRSEMLTGKYPFRTNIGAVITGPTSPQIDTAEMSLAKLLKFYAPQKYNTACVGKWHLTLGVQAKYTYPNILGFDYYSGNFNGAIPDFYNYTKVTNGIASTVTNYATTETVNDAINWLDTMDNTKPYFLWLAFNAPHTPLHVPPSNLVDITGLTGTTQDINVNGANYLKADLEAMDTEIGRLFTYLITNNLMDSTTIIFMGDNGNATQTSQNPIKTKSKDTVYDYGVRVPLIVSGPSVVNPNRSSDALINIPDLFATILELSDYSNWLAAVPVNKLPIDGRSLMPIIQNTSQIVHDWVFTQKFTTPMDSSDGVSIRNQDYHLIRFDYGGEEFYNQTLDHFEINNLLDSTMSSTEILNYNLLCDSLHSLVNTQSCSINGILNVENKLVFNLIPNPTVNEFMIESNLNEAYNLQIYNSLGLLVQEMKVEADQKTVQSVNLLSGTYMVKLISKSGVQISSKILILND